MLLELMEAGPALEETIDRHRGAVDERLLMMLLGRMEAAQKCRSAHAVAPPPSPLNPKPPSRHRPPKGRRALSPG